MHKKLFLFVMCVSILFSGVNGQTIDISQKSVEHESSLNTQTQDLNLRYKRRIKSMQADYFRKSGTYKRTTGGELTNCCVAGGFRALYNIFDDIFR